MLGRYNLTPANRKGGRGSEYEFRGEFYGTMTALMGAGVTIVIERAMESSMSSAAALRFGYDAKAEAEADMNAAANIRMDVVLKLMEMAGVMSANMQRVLEDPMRMEAAMNADTAISITVMPEGELYSDLQALWHSLQIKETVMRFENLTIPPGGTVVIDSEFFTAAADGKNIVDLYDGDWIMLTSRLKAIEARGISSGDLDVKVLYREMYL